MIAASLLKTSKKHVILKGETYNSIVDALVDKPLTQPGYSFSDRQSATDREDKSDQPYFFFTAEVPLPFRSVFSATNFGVGFNDPPIMSVDAISTSGFNFGSPFGLFTNVQPYNPENGYGLCRAIGDYQPVLLYCSDPELLPQVGMPCGSDPNPLTEWGVAYGNYGLLCISEPDVEVGPFGEQFNVWCIRTPDPISLIGTIVDNDIPGVNQSTGTLGFGAIQVQYKNYFTAILQDAFGPNGALLQLPVWNTGKKIYKVGDSVKVISVIGVGLVIIDSTSLIYGRVKSANIAHFTSGLVSIYTGNPGFETWDGLTDYNCFNHKEEVVRGEWCFLTPSGNTDIPYYIVATQRNGKVLGKTIADVKFNITTTLGDSYQPFAVDVYGGAAGTEIDTGFNITAQASHGFFGAIPAGTFVECIHLGGDVNQPGAWYVTSAKKGTSFAAKVVDSQAPTGTGFLQAGSTINVELLDGPVAGTPTGLIVKAYNQYFPVLNLELVQIEWNGDVFIVTSGELDGGFQCTVVSDIADGGTGYVYVLPIGNYSEIPSSSNVLFVHSPMGPAETGRRVRVFRNISGFDIAVKSCS